MITEPQAPLLSLSDHEGRPAIARLRDYLSQHFNQYVVTTDLRDIATNIAPVIDVLRKRQKMNIRTYRMEGTIIHAYRFETGVWNEPVACTGCRHHGCPEPDPNRERYGSANADGWRPKLW